jgi:hypothetical protein
MTRLLSSRQHLAKADANRLAIKWPRHQALVSLGVVLRPIQCQPDGLEALRIIQVARKKVPMKVRDLVAKQLVVDFGRTKSVADGPGHLNHLVEVVFALDRREVE